MPPVEQGVMVIEEREDEEPKASPDELISQLVTLGSYVNQLYLQSHLIHLNIEAPYFLSIHKFLGKQYEAHIEQFDALFEYVRSMDYLLPMCAKGLASACKKFNNVKSYEAREMLTTYLNNLETAAQNIPEQCRWDFLNKNFLGQCSSPKRPILRKHFSS